MTELATDGGNGGNGEDGEDGGDGNETDGGNGVDSDSDGNETETEGTVGGIVWPSNLCDVIEKENGATSVVTFATVVVASVFTLAF